ncbi:hypothetical protein GCM10010401_04090 [Rarobacter faecitabidus]|uniref:Sortase A n=1 Tax=Rarobacter faecitabidus TaxID=13243 RepID=A0A542ZU05_RARFA|nr:class C sortase [Rarobacter faecitabidus]TQL63835.1 sortase A [Rarobacter faecitabidus]
MSNTHGDAAGAGAGRAPAPPAETAPLAAAPGESSQSRRAAGTRERRWRLPKSALFIALVCLTGVTLLLYPSAAAWLAQYNQSRAIDTYNNSLREIGPQQRDEALEEATAYNADLVAGRAVVGAGSRIPTSDGADSGGWDYETLLRADNDGLMARIKIPAIDVDLPIYHGTDDETLLHGVGHLEGTALPVGGDSTHAVLTAHRGLASATLFTNLDRVNVGDRFVIEVFAEVLTYEVVETQVVEPEDTQTLQPQAGRDLVTLVTCTPVGINSHRILVTGERVHPTPPSDLAGAGHPSDLPRFPWWVAIAGGSLILVGLYVWSAGRVRRTGERDGPDAESAIPA